MVKNDLEKLLKRDDIGVEVMCGSVRLYWDTVTEKWVVKAKRSVIYRGNSITEAANVFNNYFDRLA